MAINYQIVANLYIISGCNGAGKTTASYTILPEMLNCKEFINEDEIAKGLSGINNCETLVHNQEKWEQIKNNINEN